MVFSRTVLFYAAPPVILGTLFAVYRIWFAGGDETPDQNPDAAPPAVVEPAGPLSPFGDPGPKPPPAAPVRPTTADTSPLPAADEPIRDLTAAAQWARDLAATLFAAFPEVAAWAALPDAIQRTVAAADCIAQGGSPRRHLSFLAPAQPFKAKQTAAGWVIDPASYNRYDRVVGAFCAGDAARVAAAFRRLEPALDLAYRGLGYGDGAFREVLGRAAGELLAVPVPAEPVAVVPSGHTFSYADPALQSQSDARKHLLRMGPANVRKVQARARELAAAAGVAVVAP